LELLISMDDFLVKEEGLTLRECLQVIDRGGVQIAIVVDNQGCLFGVLTDGDVRRALLSGARMEDGASPFINRNPVTLSGESSLMATQLCERHDVKHIILGAIGASPIGLYRYKSKAIEMPPAFILAGGKGIRLRPLTLEKPKPLIEVGGRPILHRVLESLSEMGVEKVYLSVNYMGEKIEESISDGSRFGLSVEYVREQEPMGTSGPLALLKDLNKIEELLVMNADLLSNADFRSLVAHHRKLGNHLTIAVREHLTSIPFGVVKVDDGVVSGIEEKPSYLDMVSAGIYCISNPVFSLIPTSPSDMPDLINHAVANGNNVGVFLMHQRWIDIGSPGDLQRAQEMFKERD
jgi:dTDP-glucose pyrophosphorylase